MFYGIIGFLIGVIIVSSFCWMNHHRKINNMSGMKHDMSGTMNGMMQGLHGKSGDDFDKAFIEEMIVHHEGAVAMAQMALTNAKHEEIKTMANEIISAQTSEISQMKSWLKDWYKKEL